MKQETLEKAAKEFANNSAVTFYEEGINVGKYQGFINGAKWQAERMYSEEDLLSAFEAGMMFIGEDKGSFREWFEQFKKK
jgi:hypothetical protein